MVLFIINKHCKQTNVSHQQRMVGASSYLDTTMRLFAVVKSNETDLKKAGEEERDNPKQAHC